MHICKQNRRVHFKTCFMLFQEKAQVLMLDQGDPVFDVHNILHVNKTEKKMLNQPVCFFLVFLDVSCFFFFFLNAEILDYVLVGRFRKNVGFRNSGRNALNFATTRWRTFSW